MSRRHATTHVFGVITGLFIIPAGLAGSLLLGIASPAPAATTSPCTAQLTAIAASATPSPSPDTTVSSPASATPTPTPAPATSSPPATPTTSPPASSTPSPSPSPSPSSTSPSPSPSTTQLCLTVQALAASVRTGGQARYAIWVWLSSGVSGSAKVGITAKPGKLAPSFTVCASPGGTSCSVALTVGAQPVQLRAAVAVPQNAAGTTITLTATGTSPQAAAAASASGSVPVAAASAPGTTPAGTATTPGVGVLAPGAGVNLPLGVLPSAGLPGLPNPTDPSLAFPQVSPSPDPTPAPSAIQASEVSASFPLDTRLVGGQIIGLAVLAAAVTIAVARLSIRKQRPQHSQDSD
jgi:hypothetical protein